MTGRHITKLLGRVKVWELARLAGISVDELVARVVEASEVPVLPWPGPPVPVVAPAPAPPVGPLAEPPLTELAGRATLREVRERVDRWLLAVVLEEHGENVTHAAARLDVSRRKLRERWAKVRDLPIVATDAGRSREYDRSSTPLPAPSLANILAEGGTYAAVHEAVGRWLIACALHRAGGNVTQAAKQLDTSRRFVRKLRGDEPLLEGRQALDLGTQV